MGEHWIDCRSLSNRLAIPTLLIRNTVMSEETVKPQKTLTLPVHHVRDLVGPDGRATLMLEDDRYTLRITRTGKLILTK